MKVKKDKSLVIILIKIKNLVIKMKYLGRSKDTAKILVTDLLNDIELINTDVKYIVTKCNDKAPTYAEAIDRGTTGKVINSILSIPVVADTEYKVYIALWNSESKNVYELARLSIGRDIYDMSPTINDVKLNPSLYTLSFGYEMDKYCKIYSICVDDFIANKNDFSSYEPRQLIDYIKKINFKKSMSEIAYIGSTYNQHIVDNIDIFADGKNYSIYTIAEDLFGNISEIDERHFTILKDTREFKILNTTLSNISDTSFDYTYKLSRPAKNIFIAATRTFDKDNTLEILLNADALKLLKNEHSIIYNEEVIIYGNNEEYITESMTKIDNLDPNSDYVFYFITMDTQDNFLVDRRDVKTIIYEDSPEVFRIKNIVVSYPNYNSGVISFDSGFMGKFDLKICLDVKGNLYEVREYSFRNRELLRGNNKSTFKINYDYPYTLKIIAYDSKGDERFTVEQNIINKKEPKHTYDVKYLGRLKNTAKFLLKDIDFVCDNLSVKYVCNFPFAQAPTLDEVLKYGKEYKVEHHILTIDDIEEDDSYNVYIAVPFGVDDKGKEEHKLIALERSENSGIDTKLCSADPIITNIGYHIGINDLSLDFKIDKYSKVYVLIEMDEGNNSISYEYDNDEYSPDQIVDNIKENLNSPDNNTGTKIYISDTYDTSFINISVVSLNDDTNYKIHTVAEDLFGNLSKVLTGKIATLPDESKIKILKSQIIFDDNKLKAFTYSYELSKPATSVYILSTKEYAKKNLDILDIDGLIQFLADKKDKPFTDDYIIREGVIGAGYAMEASIKIGDKVLNSGTEFVFYLISYDSIHSIFDRKEIKTGNNKINNP